MSSNATGLGLVGRFVQCRWMHGFYNVPFWAKEMSQGVSLFRGLGSFFSNEKSINRLSESLVPLLKLQVDKEVYRSGDFINVTIKIINPGLIDEGP